ncbi:MAG TPA: hypothetical protein VM657_02080 [Sphingomonas sp.]|nr:hypothetical protein [Sphingomonas sp.]
MAWMVPVGVVAAISVSHAFRTWVRAKHGYPVDDERGNLVGRNGSLTTARENALLKQENDRLNGKVDRLEERLAVLERIATDPAERTARDIEALR